MVSLNTFAVCIFVIFVFVIIAELVVCLVEEWEERREAKAYAAQFLGEQFTLNMKAMAARQAMLDEAMKHLTTAFFVVP